eukprot:TRINITY_DN1764_c0_g1_i1.p4 TRINITY_DN1764_c0_g1~~TRINITY_DN1764_c0_g1_i1.p4  ORF type:complete len:412 (+),score=61.32 TRINITY_DN1764_c0_g1_i1:7502-8737(+)
MQVKTAEQWKNEGNAAYKVKDYQRAIEAYEKALEGEGSNKLKAIIKANMANAYFQLGKYVESLQAAAKGCALDSSNLKVFYWKAMGLWKTGKIEEGLEIAEGLLKKDIGNVQFKELAQKLVIEYQDTKITNTVFDIRRCMSENNEKELKNIIDRNHMHLDKVLIDSNIIHNLIMSLWENRKKPNHQQMYTLIYFLTKSIEIGLEPIRSDISMIGQILVCAPIFIPEFAKLLIQAKTDIGIDFAITLLTAKKLEERELTSICDLLLSKADSVKITVPIARKVVQEFLDKFAEILINSTEPYAAYKQCVERIAAFAKLVEDKDEVKEIVKENILFVQGYAQENLIKSLMASEIFAIIDSKACIDFLTSKDLLVLFNRRMMVLESGSLNRTRQQGITYNEAVNLYITKQNIGSA